MSVALALGILAWVDCMLCGFRMAAGRNGRLEKHGYYTRAVARAAGFGAVLVALHVGLVAVLCATASDPSGAWASFVEAARPLVVVYGAFATVIFIAFGFYFAPIGDFRVLTNVIVFGPLTLVRPAVMAFGLALAVWRVPEWRVAVVAISAAGFMLSFERVLGRRYMQLWRRLI